MDTIQSRTTNILQSVWAKYGLIGAGLASMIILSEYFVYRSLLYNAYAGWLPHLILFMSGVYAAIDKRRTNGGQIEFAQATAVSFGAFVIGEILFLALSILLYTVVDPSLVQTLILKQLANLEIAVKSGSVEIKMLDMVRNQIATMGPARLFILDAFRLFLFVSIGSLILYLITSIFIKRTAKS